MDLTEYARPLAKEFNVKPQHAKNLLELLDGGATIPFLARYRKEATGGMDEVMIAELRKRWTQLVELDQRKAYVLKTIEELGKLNPQLADRIKQAQDMQELEDLFLPYKPKRKTRAQKARDHGLEPLAGMLMKQNDQLCTQKAKRFVCAEFPDAESVLKGARDIMAEWASEHAGLRKTLRNKFQRQGVIRSKVQKEQAENAQKYRDFFGFEEPLHRCRGHRFLAMQRGEREGFLSVKVAIVEDEALEVMERIFVRGRGDASDQVKLALKDSFKRLLAPSIETETRSAVREKAEAEAIHVFTRNLEQLLLAPPLGSKRILAIDPGFRTGCKVVCLNAQGELLYATAVFPHAPQTQVAQASETIQSLVKKYNIEAFAIGNGTAGRETEQWIRGLWPENGPAIYVVNEDGASVYSASAIAREEFPNEDVTVRGAVSIGRRLSDPLAELVKIDPKSIGVGQYQHDLDQANLKSALDEVVERAVNRVGVNLNTASQSLLAYVAGVGPKLAEKIITHRNQIGMFSSRKELLKVSGLGPKGFEQAAGFLRIPKGKHPLDNSAVHPESYAVALRMAKDLNTSLEDLIGDSSIRDRIDLNRYTTDAIGLPSLQDILDELVQPGRDPREEVSAFSFDSTIKSMEDLRAGMELPGIVTNITNFGAFVDIGLKQDGLVHVSQLADRFVRDPLEVISLQQQVQVQVVEVDLKRKRIQLTMKGISQKG